MEKSLRWKLILCFVSALASLYFLSPTIWSLANPEQVDKAPKWMPKTAMKLGLDLQGGVHMVLGVDLDKVVVNQLAACGRSFEKFAESKGIKGIRTQVNEKGFELEIHAPSEAVRDQLGDIISRDFSVLEFVGESGNIVVTRLTRVQEEEVRNKAIDQSIETIRNRIDEFGVAEPIIARKGNSQILVQFPGAKEPERLKSLIGQTAQLMFHIVPQSKDPQALAAQQQQVAAWISEAERAGNYNRDTFSTLSEYRRRLNEDLKTKLPADTTIAFERNSDVNVKDRVNMIPYLLSTKNVLSGEYIEDAHVSMDRPKGGIGPETPAVNFKLNAVGAPLLSQLTTEFRGYYMAIVLDGVVKSAPVIQSTISDSGQITIGRGTGTEDALKEARDTAIVLRAGALPASIEVQEERVIGPSIGRDAIEAGKSALIITYVLVFFFTWAYYGFGGLVANAVTLFNVTWIFALLGMIGATLTLPGIAGIVLTIGMAVDAMIIVFERMREERRAGRNMRQMIDAGFDKAFSTILDSNVTTAIGAFVLLQYGTGSIRGFALTLLVGIAINLFMATFFAKVLLLGIFSWRKKEIGIGLSNRELKEMSAR